MFEIFRRRVGAKIVLGYLASMSLMVIVAILVAVRLTHITATVNDLANSQAIDVELSNTIVNQIALARLYANRYIIYQSQADMDAYQVVFTQLQAALIQADQKITQPERVDLLRRINTNVKDYDATFDQITALLAQRQQIKSQVLDVQDLVIENELTALRVNLSANGSTLFLAYGNAQNAVQSMRLNALKYLASGDARYIVLFDKGDQQAQAAFTSLKAALTDPGQLRNNAEAEAAVNKYAQGFKDIQPGYAQQTQLAQNLETLESSISQSASDIALRARRDSEAKNVATQAFVAQTQLVFLTTILGAIAIGLFLGWGISRGITTPLQEVVQTAQQIAKVDLKTMSAELVALSEGKLALGLDVTAAPLDVKSSDEVGQTAHAFNAIIFSLQLAEQSFRNMTTYLNEMADAARSVAQGQLDVNVAVRSPQDVLGNALAAMIVNLRASHAQVRRQFQQLAALRQIDALIISSFDLESTLKFLTEQVARQLDVDAVQVLLYDQPTQRLECVAWHAGSLPDTQEFRQLGDRCASQVIAQNQAISLNNLAEAQSTAEQTLGFVVYHGTPLHAKGQIKGVLQVFHHAPLQPDDDWLNYFETLAGQAAIAIDNTELVRGLEERVALRTAELRESLRALQESEERYRALVETSPDAITVTDLNGKPIMVNRRAVELTGFASIEELMKVNIFDLIAQEDRSQVIADAEKIIEAGGIRDVAYTVRRKDGSRFSSEMSISVIENAEGKPAAVMSVTRDITERKRAEEALRRNEENFRKLFETNPFPLFISRAIDGSFVQINQAFADYLEVLPSDLISRSTLDFYAQPTDRQILLNEIKTNGRVVNQVVEIRTGQGRPRFAMVNMLPLDFSGEPCLMAGLADITERKQMEEALLQAKAWAEERSQAAESADRAKSIFLTNMSHELRTPLSAILGFSDLMARDAALSAEQQENLAIINRSGEHLLNLINNVLDMAKIESGRMVLQEQVFDLYHLLNNMSDMFRLRAADKGLSLIVDCASDVPRYVRADESKLRQILINLLGNAIKFTTDGGVSLRVRCAEYEHQPAEVIVPRSATFRLLSLEVQDTGPGIDFEDLETVFEPFVQSASGYKSTEGTGLGLPIARQFARLMGGELSTARPDALQPGALFKLSIPVELAMASDLPDQQKTEKPRAIKLEAGQRAPDRDTVPGGPYRLLVVEDHEESRRLLVKLLTQLGFEVRAAVNGLEGVNLWRVWQPHLIWMDMRMPVMDGHEATRQIKATPPGQATIIVALTATAFDDQRELILAEGCDDFVRKPYRESDIVDALVKHLGVRFIYAGGSDTAYSSALPRSALNFTGLSADWIAHLKQAVIAADADRVVALAEQIRQPQPVLATALIDRINSFDLDAILEAISAVEVREVAGE